MILFCNCLGRSRFGPKRPILRHTSPIFSSDATHRTQKMARRALTCLLSGLKTADMNCYLIFLFRLWQLFFVTRVLARVSVQLGKSRSDFLNFAEGSHFDDSHSVLRIKNSVELIVTN
jgi:hypothetical protein